MPDSQMPTSLVCSGCGATVPTDAPAPFVCAHAGDDADVDHILVRHLDVKAVDWSTDADETNPFV